MHIDASLQASNAGMANKAGPPHGHAEQPSVEAQAGEPASMKLYPDAAQAPGAHGSGISHQEDAQRKGTALSDHKESIQSIGKYQGKVRFDACQVLKSSFIKFGWESTFYLNTCRIACSRAAALSVQTQKKRLMLLHLVGSESRAHKQVFSEVRSDVADQGSIISDRDEMPKISTVSDFFVKLTPALNLHLYVIWLSLAYR